MKKRIGVIVLVIIVLIAISLPIGFVEAKQEKQKWKSFENKAYEKNISAESQPNDRTFTNRYLVKLWLNPFTHQIKGYLALNYTNKANIPFDDLYFHLYPNAFKKNKGWTRINWVKDGKDQPLDYEIIGSDSTILKVKLAKSLEPKKRMTIKLNFKISIPNIKSRFGQWNDTYNLGNALPIISLYDKGWNNDPYFPFGESFNSEFSFYKVSITLPNDFIVAATGSPIKTVHNKNSTKTIYYETGLVREFVFVTSKYYKIISDKWEDITINSYYSKRL
jgi:hypothetical protein